jgi:protein-S-isoprenylcysteine O-methyltransferase Ste14
MLTKQVLITVVVGVALYFLVWPHRPVAWTIMPIVGACLLGPGFILWSIARIQLGNSFAVTAQARHLVTHGLYSKIRNPIYFFGSWVIIGLILLVQRPIWLLVFLILIPLQIWRAGKESSVLEAAFGEEYRTYRAGTWF